MSIRRHILLVAALGLLSVFLVTIFGPTAGQAMQSAPRNLSRVVQATLEPTFGPVVGGGPTVATAAAIPNVTPTPLPTLQQDMMGIQIYGNLQEDLWRAAVDRAQFMGFKWIKLQLSWKELEPDAKGTFTQQFSVLADHSVYAARRGFKILLSIAKAPDWARPANARGQHDGPPANPADLAEIITQVFNQFGESAKYISALEIWNEANTVAEWTGAALDAGTYMKYFNPAYQAVRAKSATVTVVTAGPAPAADTPGSVDDRHWIQQLYDAGLPKNDPNLAIGVHPYGWANAPEARCCTTPSHGWDDHPTFFFLDTINDYHAILTKNNDAGRKLWATEFGWATFQGLHYKDHVNGPAALPPVEPGLAWMNILTESQQADYTVRAFQLAESGDLASFMGPMILWNMNFSTLPGYVNADKPSLPEAGYSVLDNDWNTRPIYLRLQAAPKR